MLKNIVLPMIEANSMNALFFEGPDIFGLEENVSCSYLWTKSC
jgi:hypothetical protein